MSTLERGVIGDDEIARDVVELDAAGRFLDETHEESGLVMGLSRSKESLESLRGSRTLVLAVVAVGEHFSADGHRDASVSLRFHRAVHVEATENVVLREGVAAQADRHEVGLVLNLTGVDVTRNRSCLRNDIVA